MKRLFILAPLAFAAVGLTACTAHTVFDTKPSPRDGIPEEIVDLFQVEQESVRYVDSLDQQLVYVAKSTDSEANCVLSYANDSDDYSPVNWTAACSTGPFVGLISRGQPELRFYPEGVPSSPGRSWQVVSDFVLVRGVAL